MTDINMNELRAARLAALAKAPIKPVMKLEIAPKISTGSIVLDDILDGGYGVGRGTILWGKEQSMKSTFAQIGAYTHTLLFPSEGIAWFATEAPPTLESWQRIGLDNPGENIDVYSSSSYTAEEMLDQIRYVLDLATDPKKSSHVYRMVIWDSVAASMWKDIADKKAGDNKMAVGARRLTEFLTANESRFIDAGITILFVNQVRSNLDAYDAKYNPHVMPGGKRLAHFASTIIKFDGSFKTVKTSKQDASGDKYTDYKPTGAKVRATISKNKLAPPLRRGVIEFNFNDHVTEISRAAELAIVARETGVFTLKGGEPSFNGNSKYFPHPETGEVIDIGDITQARKRLAADQNLFGVVLDCVQQKWDDRRSNLIQRDGVYEQEGDEVYVDPETGEILDDEEEFALNEDEE